MDIGRDSAALLFAAACIGIGAFGILKGKITFGGDGADSERVLLGRRAHIPAAVLFIAGLTLLTGSTWGYFLVLIALLLPGLLGRGQS
jgi:hypothetical protein